MKKILFLIIVGVGIILTASSASANLITYNLNDEFTGGTDPAGDPPWLTATVEDIEPIDVAGTETPRIRLTMSALNLTGDDEFVSEWYFNWNFNLPVPAMELGAGTTGPTPAPFWSEDYYNVGGGQVYFDVLFDFFSPNNLSSDRFDAGEIVILELTGDGLTASAFDFKDTTDSYYTAAHVQGIGDNGQFSGKIAATESISAIPEPGTFLMLGAGLASLLGIRRFKFKK